MRREWLTLIAVGLLGSAVAVTSACDRSGGGIVGARVALPAGARVTLGDVMSIERPPTLPLEQAVPLERASTILGATLARDIAAGAPITLDDVSPVGAPRTGVNRPRRVASPTSGHRGHRASRQARGVRRRARRAR
jgi:hypothetical protein